MNLLILLDLPKDKPREKQRHQKFCNFLSAQMAEKLTEEVYMKEIYPRHLEVFLLELQENLPPVGEIHCICIGDKERRKAVSVSKEKRGPANFSEEATVYFF
jgi:CRISPR-associated endonuclease Cas2